MQGSRVLLGLVILASACIIPDTDIQVFSLDSNANAVRIVEGIPLSEEARCACDANTCECPVADLTGLPTFLDPIDPNYQFCICGENQIDDNRLPGTRLLAEDQDEFEGDATDPLFAALLLDWSPTLGQPAFDYVAYRSYLDPSGDLPGYFSSYENQIIKRPRPFARSISLSDDSGRFDLCNGAGKTLTGGFHTLTLIVTDRAWFQTSGGFDETDATSDGPEPMPVVLEGVPDIAQGATYDIETYVFHCFVEGEDECQCASLDP